MKKLGHFKNFNTYSKNGMPLGGVGILFFEMPPEEPRKKIMLGNMPSNYNKRIGAGLYG
jgi:hypothetical protein